MANEDLSDAVRAELNAPIDEQNLLHEWKGQAALMLEYGIQLADAMQEADEAKAALAVKAAELARDIRANPADYDGALAAFVACRTSGSYDRAATLTAVKVLQAQTACPGADDPGVGVVALELAASIGSSGR